MFFFQWNIFPHVACILCVFVRVCVVIWFDHACEYPHYGFAYLIYPI